MYVLYKNPIWMNFGTEVVLEGRKVLGGVRPCTNAPKGVWVAPGASGVHFGRKLYNIKVAEHPQFSGN